MNSIVRLNTIALALLVASCLFLDCCNTGPAAPEAQLPRGYGDIMLGDRYSPSIAGGGSEYSTPDGRRHVRIERSEKTPPVEIELGKNGIVESISWGRLVAETDRQEVVKQRAKERYGKFLVREKPTNGGTALVFEDDSTIYRLKIHGEEVRFSITNLSVTSEDKGTP